jgi:hypothetical protein
MLVFVFSAVCPLLPIPPEGWAGIGSFPFIHAWREIRRDRKKSFFAGKRIGFSL